MNKKPLTLVGMSVFAASLISHAAIVDGDVIAIDFGETATTEANWNTGVIDDTIDLIRLSDGANTDVDLTISSVGGAWSSNVDVFQDGSAQGGSSVFEIYDDGIIIAGLGDDEITLTFTGLDDSLTYNLFAGGQTGADFGANWTISTSATGGVSQDTNYQDTDSYVFYTGITSVGGTFSITINDISNGKAPTSGRNIGISELTLTAIAVPEPSSYALIASALALTSVMLRRRRA
jgi:hypothetical protein